MIKLNNNVIEFGRFPNKETNLKIDSSMVDEDNIFVFEYETDASLIELMLVKKEVDYLAPRAESTMIIKYMPYSRLDRREDGVAFTLKYVSEFINSLGFTTILVAEPHSDVTCGILNNVQGVLMTPIIFENALENKLIDFDPKVDYICFPDAGAQKKYAGLEYENTVIGMKHRDFKTGRIAKYDIYIPQGNQDPKFGPTVEYKDVKGKNVVILDDLCSRGGTFILMASALRNLGAKTVSLVVTHCENTIFDGDIFKTDLIDVVITSNSIVNQRVVDDYVLGNRMYIYDLENIG